MPDLYQRPFHPSRFLLPQFEGEPDFSVGNHDRLSSNIELLWASSRELLNIFQADAVGCDIITATNDILKKLELHGKDLGDFSLETVKMFRDDAVKAGFTL